MILFRTPQYLTDFNIIFDRLYYNIHKWQGDKRQYIRDKGPEDSWVEVWQSTKSFWATQSTVGK